MAVADNGSTDGHTAGKLAPETARKLAPDAAAGRIAVVPSDRGCTTIGAMIADVSPDPHAASVNVRMTLEQRQHVQEIADTLGVTVSSVVRTALSIGLPKTRSAIEDAIDESKMADAILLDEAPPKRR